MGVSFSFSLTALCLPGGVKRKCFLIHHNRHVSVCLSGSVANLDLSTPRVTSGKEWPSILGKGAGRWRDMIPLSLLNSNISPLAKNQLPHLPIAPNTKPNGPPVHFCFFRLKNMKCYLRSPPLNRAVFMTDKISISRKKKSQFQRVFSMHSGQNLFRGCTGEEVRKNRLRNEATSERKLDLFHSTWNAHSHTRLRVAHAKDA